MWRVAKSLEVLRGQVNERWPDRNKANDGTIGDEAHASRSSDHNPWVKEGAGGVVTAMDITHDPKSGCDAGAIAEALRESRDPRIKYIISNRRICSGSQGPSPWAWRKYSGSNPHDHHFHLSVRSERTFYDDTGKWSAIRKVIADRAPEDDEPKSIGKSKIAITSGVVGIGEMIDAGTQVQEVLNTASSVKDSAQNLGVIDVMFSVVDHHPRFMFAVVVVIACAAIAYWRWRDHGRGQT